MKINALSNFYQAYSCNSNKTNNSAIKQKNIAFNGYKETLAGAITTEVKDTKTAKDLFDTLFKEVNEEPSIHRNPIFYEMEKVYKKSGFKGLLEELRQPKDDNGIIAQTLNNKEENFIQAITQYGQPLFELFNFGRFGHAKNAPSDIRVIFRDQNQRGNIEFNLGKNLNLNVARCNEHGSIDTEYYTTTGTPKVVIKSEQGSQERTFFNEDGSKPFFKNWLLGGSTTSIY